MKQSSSPSRSEVLQAQITHTSAMIALCKASDLPSAEVSYRAQLARLTQELHEADHSYRDRDKSLN
jgi:hypothetical protein